jgi:serine/threonine-protein kinase
MLRAHLYTDPEPMPPVAELPDPVADLVRRCLAKRPADRPTSAEVAAVLATAVGRPAPLPVSPAGGAEADAAALANAGTTILPWSVRTDALPRSGVRTRRAAARRRKLGRWRWPPAYSRSPG